MVTNTRRGRAIKVAISIAGQSPEKRKEEDVRNIVIDIPTGKDNVIVSAGRAKVIPAGRTILVL
ncbi:hypothetical protein Tco_1126486, partial [Tanacetum coccineum]